MQPLTKSRREAIYTPAMLMLVLIVCISFLGLGFIMPLRALYGRQMGATSVEISWLTSSFLLAAFCSSPAIGWLAERYGYRRVLWVGLLAHTLLMLAYIPVQNPLVLIGLRALEGVASASVLPPARAIVNAIAPKTRQGEALGVLSAAQAVGILLGPVAGTLLASQVGYTPSFLAASGALGLSVLATLFLPAQVKRPSESSRALEGPVAFGGWITRPLVLAYTLQIVLQVTQGVISAIWTLYMLDQGASLPMIGLSFTTFALPLIVFTPLIGRLSDRVGRYWLVVLGVLAFGIIFFVYSLQLSPLWMIILSAVEGTAAAIARSALDGLLADVMPTEGKAKVQANYSAAGTLGSFLGATAAGVFYGMNHGLPFLAAGLLCLLMLGMLFVPPVVRLFPIKRTVFSE